jgi:hypothetical protein
VRVSIFGSRKARSARYAVAREQPVSIWIADAIAERVTRSDAAISRRPISWMRS